MSSEMTPVVSKAIKYFELFMTDLESLGSEFRELKPWTDIGLSCAKKYYVQMDDTDAYVISMCKFLT
jgi:hypothetical protein